MAERQKDLIVEPAEFHVYLKAWMDAHDIETTQELADYLGVTREFLYMFFKGKRLVTKKMVKKLGGRFVIAIPSAAKGKK